ncbi:RagB/SusD family nutrient uptake outer membrane protein [Polaribacter atrinae]|uniref:Glycan metabolism protein RagB n=1 Tax=Polaribacter atrinae TaxID=1333662 RepID=A0A176T553_9FLAO|nr:RagB/SusD family nutrient uptake outer membrane protein [Polaribacter atrinae]OAD43032.1 hypothetical protein LPB303_14045 [Polaribacter atrinae]
MKYNFKQTLLVFTVFATFFSCSEEYLEITPTEYISNADVAESGKTNSAITQGTLNGLYSMMINTETGGTSRHEDFGQKGYDIMTDMLSGDMALSLNSYNRYSAIANLLSTVDYTSNFNYMPWRYYYRLIKSSNLVIESLGGNEAEPTTDDVKFGLGQAKTIRANAYFNLAQMFATEYNASTPVVPLYKSSTDPVQGQATMEELYDFIIEDLNSAISLLNGITRASKSQVNQDVAKGILAYVYASKNESSSNSLAKDLAEQVIASGYPLTTHEEAIGGFNDIATPSWIWGFDVTLANGLDLVSWWGQMDYYTYSYQSFGDRKAIDNGLFSKIKDSDVRKGQFHASTLMALNKFYNGAKEFRGQRNIEDDYIYMRSEEMYLLSAEMSAKGAGSDTEAKTRLKQILANRFLPENAADFSYIDGLTGNALLDEVILQTRIELWGEGKSYFSMKRNKQTMTRGTNHVFHKGLSIPYSDERLTFEIPREEVQSNPNIN